MMDKSKTEFEYYKDIPIKKKTMVEFSPLVPITDFCGFCGTQIPEKQIAAIGVTCVDCKRPVCPSCKSDIREAGLIGCPYCETVRLDEDNEGVKKALAEIYNQKLKERKQKVTKRSDETPWIMTTESPSPVMMSTSWSASSSEAPFVPGDPLVMDDQYPYRATQQESKDPILEPMENVMADLGIKKWRPKDKKEDKEDIRVTQRFTPALHTGPNISAIVSPIDLKEEAQRGTGRSTQRQLSALNHLFDRDSGRYEAGRQVLFVVSNQRMLKETKRNIRRLYTEEYTRSNIQRGTLDRIMDSIHFWNIHEYLMGIHPTLTVIDLIAPITYEQKMNLDHAIGNTPHVGMESVIIEEHKPSLPEPAGMDYIGYNRKEKPPKSTLVDLKKRRSRKEKPTRTALRCFKCGNKPDECICEEKESDWGWFMVGVILTIIIGSVVVWAIFSKMIQ